MDFEKVLALRQSVRSYTEEAVEEEDIQKLVEAANRAPVGMHRYEGYHLTVITDKNLLNKMVETFKEKTGENMNPLYGAPLFILVSATDKAKERTMTMDAGCITENMHLMATDLGLESVYIYGLVYEIKNEKEWQKMAGLSDSMKPICGLAVGHGTKKPTERPYKEWMTANRV